MDRRTFLSSAGAVLAASLAAPALVRLTRKAPRPILGGFVNDDAAAGHSIRDHFPRSPAARKESATVVIVGGGIAGLSAAWELQRRGARDFVVLELAAQPGGNARWGENDVSAYPWAAHYVPVPDTRATLARELFTELGLLKDGAWEERHLCFTPQERLFVHGEWHAGIVPDYAVDRRGRDELRRFDDLMAELHASDEFTIPMAAGVRRDSTLDRISMAEWLRAKGFASPALLWYVDYACRDDYGALARDTSAWAGVHYFASRPRSETGPLTWPEGNGWIVKQLLSRLGAHVRTSSPVSRIERLRRASGSGRDAWRVVTAGTEYRADAIIFAAPSFLAPYVVEGMESERSAFVYSPWLTANITLDHWPRETSREAPPAWDNVLYDSPALGYVVATHQSLRARDERGSRRERTVWTYYWALADDTPSNGRRVLAARDWPYWRDRILDDLARAHPDIRECVSRIDVMRHGHAMIRPTPGFLTSRERLVRARLPRFELAHSDRSGLSLFEEAQYQGVSAARRVLHALGEA